MTLSDLLPSLLLHIKDMMSAKIVRHPDPPAALLDHGLMEHDGRLTNKGHAFLVRVYGLADTLDVAIA